MIVWLGEKPTFLNVIFETCEGRFIPFSLANSGLEIVEKKGGPKLIPQKEVSEIFTEELDEETRRCDQKTECTTGRY